MKMNKLLSCSFSSIMLSCVILLIKFFLNQKKRNKTGNFFINNEHHTLSH